MGGVITSATAESTSIAIKGVNDNSEYSGRTFFAKIGTINFTRYSSYSYLKIAITNADGYSDCHFCIKNSGLNTLSTTYFSNSNKEQTVSMSMSGISVTGFIYIYAGYIATKTGSHTFNINQIYFT